MSNANLYSILSQHFPADAGSPCLIVADGGVWSYDDIERASGRIANFLATLQLPPASRVAVQVDKSAEAFVLYLACLRSGLVFLPLNTAYQRHEMRYFLSDAQPAVFVCRPQFLGTARQLAAQGNIPHLFTLDEKGRGSLIDAAAPFPDRFSTALSAPDDLAAILYTSGTTGRSKGAMLSHRNLSSNAEVLAAAWQFTADDVLLHMLPIFHIHGLFVACHCALMRGATMLFEPRFDATRAIALMPQASVFMGVPTYYTRMLADPDFDADAFRNIRLLVSGSAPLLKDTFDAFNSITGHAILERYGMTEGGMYTSNPYAGERRVGSVGLPLPGVDLRIVDDRGAPCATAAAGHIQIKGEGLFSSYWRRPGTQAMDFTTDGYFRTGDFGYVDAQGYLFVSGRARDLIISGGLNVYPKEVEGVIDSVPGVLESAVFGLPHADFGEAVHAVVVRMDNAEGAALTDTDITAVVHCELAAYKVPKRVIFADALPRNAMGKVQKDLLRERFS